MPKMFVQEISVLILYIATAINGQVHSTNPAAFDTNEVRASLALSTDIMNRQYNGMKIHKVLAFTTGGLLLANDAYGIYHFLSMRKQGHEYRDQNGYTEDNQSNEIKSIWRGSHSQRDRVIHGELIVASTICYVATATIELTLPRMDTDSSRFNRPSIHRKLFYTHAALMLANIGLGFTESYALSQGKHDLVQVLGITHAVVGFTAPVIMFGSGLVFK